ncbi:MAG: adenylate kinase [Chloroflexi bacterium]|nr:adenylate kinase [Chloroflexota bacterium]
MHASDFSQAFANHPQLGKRIVVVGTTGAGKTTLARRISQRLAIPYIELDATFWGPNWTSVPTEVFHMRTAQALNGDAWIVDGNYGTVRDITWGQANSIIWLDFSLAVILARLFRRTMQRLIQQEELWHGNRERWQIHFFSRDSLFLWALRTYHRRRVEYPVLFRQPEYAHLNVIHLRSPQDADAWLAGLCTNPLQK